jgi:hypothetical protein
MTYTEQEQFAERVKRETGRDVRLASVRCEMCGGLGFSTFEPICTNCAGDGVTDEWIYVACGCPVETDGDPDCVLCFPGPIDEESAVAA